MFNESLKPTCCSTQMNVCEDERSTLLKRKDESYTEEKIKTTGKVFKTGKSLLIDFPTLRYLKILNTVFLCSELVTNYFFFSLFYLHHDEECWKNFELCNFSFLQFLCSRGTRGALCTISNGIYFQKLPPLYWKWEMCGNINTGKWIL